MTPQTSPLGQARLPELPPLPSLVRYYDDFDDQFRTVRQLEQLSAWTITANGLSRSLNLEVGGPWHTRLLKVFVADLIARRANTTVLSYYSYFEPLRSTSLVRILESIALDRPTEFRDRWIVEFHPSLSPNQMRAVRYFASAAARMAIGQWTPGDQALVRALPGAPLDKYARVREGDCFLSVSAQSEIVQFIDEAASAASRGRADFETLRLASILALSYQYGARPGQIARIKARDVRCHPSGGVHVSIVLLKQRGQQRGRTVVRSVQREWCILFREFLKQQRDESGSKLFGYIPTQVSAAVSALTDELTGTAYSPGDLRHTAAQRLVDSGASREQVSEFLGHTDTSAVDVYFETSAKQAELVNAALGLSDIYRNVADVARTKTISPGLLIRMPPDQQVAGMPHGIPVTGLGQCKAGQSLCQRNPALACYTCHKFLPVSDVKVHSELLEAYRRVVNSFERPNHVVRASPATLQLRSTLEALQRLVAELSTEEAPDVG